METLKEAKSHLRQNFDKGVGCPCCGQFVKRYRRKVNSGMAATLIQVYQKVGKSPVNVKDFLRENKLRNGHDWTLLRHWGLIQSCSEKGDGFWRVTALGEEFIQEEVEIPSHAFFYNKKCLGLIEDEFVDIKTCLKRPFLIDELLNNTSHVGNYK